jgi:two-component system, NarL family, nitrate/nitrite response regulator NarL
VIRVLHCDDSASYRRLIAALLEPEPDIEVVAGAMDHDTALEEAARCRPDVVLLDMSMVAPRDDFGEMLAATVPGTRVLILSGNPPDRADPALRAIAVGHVRKTRAFEDLAGTIRSAVQAE